MNPKVDEDFRTPEARRNGKRMRQSFNSLPAAKKEALLVAQRIQQGLQHVTDMTPSDRVSYVTAKNLLAESGIPLVAAIEEYLKARKLDGSAYLPIDQHGANLLFQVISARYEQGSIVLTSNKAYKDWPSIFNGDAPITSAVLHRLLHHGETIVIEGSSYRMKDRLEK